MQQESIKQIRKLLLLKIIKILMCPFLYVREILFYLLEIENFF